MTGASVDSDLRNGLLSDEHGIPVMWILEDRIRQLNEPARQLLGRAGTGRSLDEFLDARSAMKIARVLSSGSTAARTELQIEQPGSPPTLVSFAVIRDGHAGHFLIGLSQGVTYSEPAGQQLLATTSELTESLRRLGREMHTVRAAKETLERIGNLRDGFVTAFAHDLRSPLNAMLLAATLPETDEQMRAEQAIGLRQIMERNIRLALELVDSIVTVSQIDAADLQLRKDQVRLIDVARRWTDALMPVASSADVSLQVTGDSTATVYGDTVRLGEVFSNLLSNALRHSPPGGCVTIEISKRGAESICCVADQGEGVPTAMRTSIFDKFSQGSNSVGLSGLGLYIARRIVDLHGGKIWVEDNAPRGSRFVFSLPAANPDAA